MPSTDPNHIGSQLPHSGKQFAGIITSTVVVGSPVTVPVNHEYLEVQLTEKLIVGEYYLASMYVSLAEGPKLASNNLGMYFGDVKIADYNNNSFLSFTPQINATEVITDTQHWVQICGVFKATSQAQYLIIGNFFDETATTIVNKGGTWGTRPNSGLAYYFIDDVSVEKISGFNQLLALRNVDQICERQSTQISSINHYDTIAWSVFPDTTKIVGNKDTLKVQPVSTTKYLAVARSCGVTYRDTISVKVNPLPKVNLGLDRSLCSGESLLLDAGVGYASYVWGDSSRNEYYNVTGEGRYFVRVKTKYGCEGGDEILISYLSPPTVNLGPDRFECAPFRSLIASGKEKSAYKWSTNSVKSEITPSASGKYWVRVENQCGIAVDTIQIYSMSDTFIPNVVTMNGDHLNDKFKIAGVPDYTLGVKVLDRWGEVIFSESQYNSTWPDQELSEGVYYFLISYPGCPDKKGWIQLLK